MNGLWLALGLGLGIIAAITAAVLIWFDKLKIENPIKAFAVLVVAVIAGYTMWIRFNLIETLSSPKFCQTALGAEKASSTEGAVKGLDACVGMLTIQLKSLATNSYIDGGVQAVSLLTLIVIVIAGGRLALEASKAGVKANIGREEQAVARAVDETVAAAEDKADQIKAETKFTPPPGEEL